MALERLTAEALKVIESGKCKMTTKAGPAIARLSDAQVARLNKLIEKQASLSVEGCLLIVLGGTPRTKFAESDKEASEKAVNLIEIAFDMDVESFIREFSKAHGWSGTVEEKEAIDAWKEARAEWDRYRNEVMEVAEAMGWK